MNLKNTQQKYGAIHMALHWLMAIVIIGLLSLGFYMKSIPYNPTLYFFHKSFGVLVFILVVIRLIWKFTNKVPEFDEKIKKPVRVVSQLGTFALYGFMISMPLTGMLMSIFNGYSVQYFGIFEIAPFVTKNVQYGKFFEEMHEVLASLFLVMILIHSAMAFIHHFLFKDNTFKKMLPAKN